MMVYTLQALKDVLAMANEQSESEAEIHADAAWLEGYNNITDKNRKSAIHYFLS